MYFRCNYSQALFFKIAQHVEIWFGSPHTYLVWTKTRKRLTPFVSLSKSFYIMYLFHLPLSFFLHTSLILLVVGKNNFFKLLVLMDHLVYRFVLRSWSHVSYSNLCGAGASGDFPFSLLVSVAEGGCLACGRIVCNRKHAVNGLLVYSFISDNAMIISSTPTLFITAMYLCLFFLCKYIIRFKVCFIFLVLALALCYCIETPHYWIPIHLMIVWARWFKKSNRIA